MSTDNPKEVYALWWEYLKRSDGYKKYCQDFNGFWQKEKQPFTASNWRQLLLDVRLELSEIKLPKKLSESRHYGNLATFGDVFNDAFERWYSDHKHVSNAWEEVFPPVQPYAESFEFDSDFVRCLSVFGSQKKREPTANEFITAFKKYLEADTGAIVLRINLDSHCTNDELIKKFADIIRKSRKQPSRAGFNTRKFMKAYWRPLSRVGLDELKRYLRVYDLHREGKKIPEIIATIGDKVQRECFDYSEVQRGFFKDLQKAKEIIKNVENGIFPRLTGK